MIQQERMDIAIIGAGVIGLSIANELALEPSNKGRSIVVLEQEQRVGEKNSTHNSGVVHRISRYPQGSLKERLSLEGAILLREYCIANGVAYSEIGKLLVATSEEEVEILDDINQRAEQNKISDLTWLNPQQIRDIEPEVSAVRGLFSPTTAIVDTSELVQSLKINAQRSDVWIKTKSPVLEGEIVDDGVMLKTGKDHVETVIFSSVINAAGLNAQKVASSISGIPSELIPEKHFYKGHYLKHTGKSPFTHLVYPVPVPGGLGVHATLDFAGKTRFGPDVEETKNSDDFGFNLENLPQIIERFSRAIRKYFPGLNTKNLQPDYVGIRPKLATAGIESDFIINRHRNLVNLFGIESPGLTASLAIAKYVSRLLNEE